MTLASSPSAWAQSGSKTDDDLNFVYAQLGAGWALKSQASLTADLGRGVSVSGRTQYGAGPAFSGVLGWQFYRDRDEDGVTRAPKGSREDEQDEAKPVRVELELWTAQLKRQQIQLGTVRATPQDAVRPQVVFLNVALPIAQSDEHVTLDADEKPRERGNEPLWRWWLGAGIGYASLSYQSATGQTGCDCLRATDGKGLAWQLKLMGERRVREDTYAFGEIGHVWLPSITSKGASAGSAEHGRWGTTHVQVGLRWAFR
jgi:hypothetical protein